MRCPECKHEQKYRDGKHCGKCGYRFVFRRKKDRISDFAFRQIIHRLSEGGHYAFTDTQLALAIARPWWGKRSWIPLKPIFLLAVISFGFGLISFGIDLQKGFNLGVGVFVTMLPLVIGLSRWGKTVFHFLSAYHLVYRYQKTHPISSLADGQAFLHTTEIELQNFQYAPERILLVERDDLVDMLIRNRFHLSHKTAVIGCSGYPEHVFAACQEFLKIHPNASVQVLHDASPEGFGLTKQLMADPKWKFAHRRLTDLGISRAALKKASALPWLPSEELCRRNSGLSDNAFLETILPDKSRLGGAMSADHTRMLDAGRRMPVDYLGPKQLMNLLGVAMVTGSFALVAANDIGEIIADADGNQTDDFG